jgi:hypothetical protein
MTCEAGKCQCSVGLTSCSNACFDLQTDQSHCGTCAGTCRDGCSAGRCFTRFTAVPSGTDLKIAVNSTHIYFTTRNASTVSRISRSGGSVELLATQEVGAGSIAVDANNVYWTTEGTTYGNGAIMKLPLAAGATKVALVTGEPSPEHVAVDANNVYWSNYPPNPSIIMKAPITGGDANKVVLASGDATTSAVEFTLDATNLYWAGWSGSEGDVWKVPLKGGAIVNLTHLTSLTALATVSGGNVYFLEGSDLGKVSTAGGTSSILRPGASTAHLVADDSAVYLADLQTNTILKIPVDGSKVVPLSSINKYSLDIAVYGTDVFWADSEAIKSTPKAP